MVCMDFSVTIHHLSAAELPTCDWHMGQLPAIRALRLTYNLLASRINSGLNCLRVAGSTQERRRDSRNIPLRCGGEKRAALRNDHASSQVTEILAKAISG